MTFYNKEVDFFYTVLDELAVVERLLLWQLARNLVAVAVAVAVAIAEVAWNEKDIPYGGISKRENCFSGEEKCSGIHKQ